MKIVTVRLPDWMLELIDQLCMQGIFICRSEFIRYAIQKTLKMLERETKMHEKETQQNKTIDDNIMRGSAIQTKETQSDI